MHVTAMPYQSSDAMTSRELTWAAGFPTSAAWTASARALLPPVAVSTTSKDGWRHLMGLAFEYAVGLDLAPDAYADRLACLPAAFADWIDGHIARYLAAPEGDGLSFLLQAACYLADVDFIVMKLGLWGSRDRTAPILQEMGAPDSRTNLWTTIEVELTALWRLYRERTRDNLRAWGHAHAAVPMDPRTGVYGDFYGAYVDLIVGSLVLEIKTGYMTSDGDLQDAYEQVTRYGRLAVAAGYNVTAHGIYLARYGLLMTWPESG